jgi:hypothetical protein
MNVLTIMDYAPHQREHLTMCRAWFWLMHRYNPDARIVVFYGADLPPDVMAYADDLGCQADFVRVDVAAGDRRWPAGLTIVKQGLFAGKWQWLMEHPMPHLFIEADALVLSSLDYLWSLRREQPFIGFTEPGRSSISGRMICNTGVFSLSDPAFINLDIIDAEYELRGGIWEWVGEQGLLVTYMRDALGYNWTHRAAGCEYNCAPGPWTVIQASRDCIDMRDADGEKMKIAHPYGPQGKFFQRADCAELWKLCIDVSTHPKG